MVEISTQELFEKVKEGLPSGANISDIKYEGCEIVLYTKSKEFFAEPGDVLKNKVMELKKRILLRPDASIMADVEKAKKAIQEIIPEEAGLREISFEPGFGTAIIEVDKPGIAIGAGGEILREIKRQIFWTPVVRRAPAIPSEVVKTLRKIIHMESEWRKDFLNKVGKRIHGGWKPTDWIRMTALGAFREVGRSAVLLSTPESRILMDCGVKPGGSTDYPYLGVPEFDLQKLDSVVLSHAHMDHAGFIPWLYEYGCEAPLYLTEPSRDLMVMMCMDMIEIAQREGRPLPYTTKGITEAVKHCVPLDWGEVSDITPDMRLTLLNDGHILGGSLVHVHIGNGLHNVLYTGDLKFDRTLLYDPASHDFARAETVITESTYGLPEDIQPRRDEAEAGLVNAVKKAIARNGKVLIPSFAVQRAQDIQVILAMANLDIPIYLDGMIWDVSALHTTYPEFMSREMQRKILVEGWNPFTQNFFKRVGSETERKKIIDSSDPAVVISTSGMLTGGPAVNYFKAFAEDKKNMMIFVGWQAENSLGRKIQRGYKEVPMEIDGRTKSVPLNLEVLTMDGLSGHSDYKQLMNYIGKLRNNPERIIANHGEAVKCIEFARNAHRIFKCETLAPRLLETVRLK